MKQILIIFFIVLSLDTTAQSTVIEIETLPPPTKTVRQYSKQKVLQFFKANPEKTSLLADSLVNYGEHSFLVGILTAYKEHRPFTISPDIFWLLINQGFARHVTNNSELLRNQIVGFAGQKTLAVSSQIHLGDSSSNWEAVFPQFVIQIKDYVGSELTDTLTSNFTTSTLTTTIVSQITIMEALKEYFKYEVIMIGCGIPKITIEGTVEDWQKLLKKTEYLSKYQLGWWVSEIRPVLKKIIKAKQGKFDKKFWMNMVKAHTEKKYGHPTTINGWITKFFPYTSEGKRTGFKPIKNIDSLASEIVKVPFVLKDEIQNKEYEMEFWGGFFGLEQNKQDFTLTPKIAWVINRKEPFNPKNSRFNYIKTLDDLSIQNIRKIPEEVYLLEQIQFLHLSFQDEIIVPFELSKIKIANLELKGKILPEKEIEIRKMFLNTKVIINGHE